MQYKLFHKGQQIDSMRTYDYAGTMMAEITIGDTRLFVKRSDLKEDCEVDDTFKKDTFKDDIVSIDKTGLLQTDEGARDADVEASSDDEKYTFGYINGRKVVGWENDVDTKKDNTNIDPEVKSEVLEDALEPEAEPVKKELKNIMAIRVSDSTNTNLGKLHSTEFNRFVKSKKLNKQAVENVLNGVNKTHKGFSFEYAI